MSVIIGVLDKFGNTDNIVFVDLKRKHLIWLPRDLYSFRIKNRINTAFSKGNHSLFIQIANDLGFRAKYSICVPLESCIEIFKNLEITVPIKEYVEYYYPKVPFTCIFEGKKIIKFTPPFEKLSGERIHQFIGARFRLDESKETVFPDFDRIYRQQIFVESLLSSNYDFSNFLRSEIFISNSEAISELKKINKEFEFKLFKNCNPVYVGKMSVLMLNNGWLKGVFYKFKILSGLQFMRRTLQFFLNPALIKHSRNKFY